MIYGVAKQPNATADDNKKAWGEFKKALEGINLKMAGPWGPFGVSEGSSFMLKGTNEDFEKYIGSDAMQKCPIEKTRTVSLFTPQWAE